MRSPGKNAGWEFIRKLSQSPQGNTRKGAVHCPFQKEALTSSSLLLPKLLSLPGVLYVFGIESTTSLVGVFPKLFLSYTFQILLANNLELEREREGKEGGWARRAQEGKGGKRVSKEPTSISWFRPSSCGCRRCHHCGKTCANRAASRRFVLHPPLL